MSKLTFEQRVVRAARFAEKGDPIKDVLEYGDEEEAIKKLADIYITLGIVDIAELD